MARGGYIGSEICVAKVAKVLGSKKKAKKALVEALCTGRVAAQARADNRITAIDRLVAIGAEDKVTPREPAQSEQISIKFWRDLGEDARRLIGWSNRTLSADDVGGSQGYVDFKIREADVNGLIIQLTPPLTQVSSSNVTEAQPRRRSADWNDWVAAVACLAHERKISADLGRGDLESLIDKRLDDWGLGDWREKRIAASTVAGATNAILRRYATNPPASADPSGPPTDQPDRQKP